MKSIKIGLVRGGRGWGNTLLMGWLGAAGLLMPQSVDAQSLMWATTYSGISGAGLEEVEGVVADGAGGVFSTGLSGAKGIGSGIRTMKLDAKGSIVWNVIHSRPALCGGMWGKTPLARDSAGNLLVIGAEFNATMDNWSPVLLRLSQTNGATLSRWVFDLGPYASFDALVVAGPDIYIVAHNNPNNGYPHIVHTLRLNQNGAVVWSDSFTPAIFWGTQGGIVVSGSTVLTAAGGKVRAHDLNGGLLWDEDLSMPNGGSALAADSAGNIYLAVQNGVAKFDTAGNVLAGISATPGQISDLDVDAAGNVYLVGVTTATSSRGSDVFTQKYSSAGKLLWSTTYGKNGGYSDAGLAISLGAGYVYVGGSRYNKDLDMCTLKYAAGN